MSPGQRRLAEVAAVALLLAIGFDLQARFFLAFPQAPLFGDSAGYYWAGQQVRKAGGGLLHGGGVAAAIGTLRPILHFLGVGALFALLDGDRPADLTRFRMLLGAISTFGMLGCYLLARALAGRLAGLLALALAAVHPSLMMSAGRLYPEPVSATVLVWSAFLYARGVQRASASLLAASGATLIGGLLFRPKLIPYLAVLLALGSLVAWIRAAGARRLVVAFAAGWLAVSGLWVAAALAVAGPVDAKLPEYNLAWKQYYPYGFWQFLDCDGWEGPYRLKTEPYYKALEAAAREDPDLLRSRPRQYLFTLRYLASRPADSALTMAASLWRLYNRPENPYRWDFPFDYEVQHLLQAVVALCAAAAAAALLSESLALAGVFFVPISLWLLHGVAFSLPRYAVPPLLIVIALAGAFLGWAVRRAAPAPRRALAAVAVPALASGAMFLLGAVLVAHAPNGARVLRFLAQALLVGLPLLLVAELSPAARRWAKGGWAVLGLILLGHDLHDARWHEVATRLGGAVTGVSQEIALPESALARLRAASEAYLVFDLSVPRGDTGRLSIEVGGRGLPGTDLVPTMLRLPEDTALGGRDSRGYPQWWALRLTPELLPRSAAEPLSVRLTATQGTRAVLRGDRFDDQARVYQGPSFGDWPHLVPVKLQYDGDYRIPIRVGLGSTDSRSGQRGADGQWQPVLFVHRIRVVTLAQNEGYARFESDPLPAAPAVAVAFAALSGSRRRVADMLFPGGAFRDVPLGSPQDFQLEQGAHRLCYRAEGRRGERPYGGFFLIGPPPTPGRPLPLEVRFRTGMREEPAFFVPDRRRELAELRSLLAACEPKAGTLLVRGVARVTDAGRNQYPEDTGRWRVAEVY